MQNDTALSVPWGESLSFRTEGTSWGIMVLFFKDSTCWWAKVSYRFTNSSRISIQFRFRSCAGSQAPWPACGPRGFWGIFK